MPSHTMPSIMLLKRGPTPFRQAGAADEKRGKLSFILCRRSDIVFSEAGAVPGCAHNPVTA
jgi:hypothetical protein